MTDHGKHEEEENLTLKGGGESGGGTIPHESIRGGVRGM